MKIKTIMCLIIINILISNFLLCNNDKPIKEDATFDIKNKKLKNELNLLKQEFESEKIKIKKTYEREIEDLKQKRQNELNKLRKEFKKKRDMLVKKNNGNKKIKKSNKNNQKPIIKSK